MFKTLAVVLALAAACLANPVALSDAEKGNLMKEAHNLDLHFLITAVRMAGLYDTLATKGPFTLFAPTDGAFMKIPEETRHALIANKTMLAEVLKYHVVSGVVKSTSLKNDLLATSLEGQKIRINIYKNGQVITATGSQVTNPDNMASNGVIHIVDRVMYPIPMGSVVDAVKGSPDLSTLLTAVTTADLGSVLAGPGPFTVFAPTNAAFSMLPAGTLAKLLKDKTALTNILKYHVVSGTVYSEGLSNGMVMTLNGKSVKVMIGSDGVMINNAMVSMANVSVTNGVVHIVDKVLLPDTEEELVPGNNLVMEAEKLGLTDLVMLVKRAGLADVIATKGPFTIFAPTNEAFEAVPAIIRHMIMRNKTLFVEALKYHVISGVVKSTDLKNELTAPSLAGPSVRINIYKDGKVITATGSQVTSPDNMASNGVIHVVDRVMFPFPFGSVVDVVKMDPHLSTLLAAVTAADLASVLSGPGPFTVFAPDNSAFAKIPKMELDKILANKPLLISILKYHVVSGTVFSKGLSNGAMVPTLNGATVDVKLNQDGVMINDANVKFADFAVTNGVVHIIDTVLLPPKSIKDNNTKTQNQILA